MLGAGAEFARKLMARKKDAPEMQPGERIAKVMARAGLCSRREAEAWIAAGRVAVNGRTISSPALNVSPHDAILVDGKPLPMRERTRLFRYHKPRGLLTTSRDPQGRPTFYEKLPAGLPRLVSVGRLDFNSEGLLLLTNDGGLKRALELPETGWQRRYRVRANGQVTQEQLDGLKHGVTVEGISYGPVEAKLDRAQGANVWLTIGLREGKNREVRNVLRSLGLHVNRLIRVSYGPFQLAELAPGAIEEVKTRTLREQLGHRLAREAGVDFEAPLREAEPERNPAVKKPVPSPAAGGGRGTRPRRPSRRGGGPRGSHFGSRKH
jgi:23S rRNA pseudouridine2605 synthase